MIWSAGQNQDAFIVFSGELQRFPAGFLNSFALIFQSRKTGPDSSPHFPALDGRIQLMHGPIESPGQ